MTNHRLCAIVRMSNLMAIIPPSHLFIAHSRKFVVEVPMTEEVVAASLFEYGPLDTFEVIVNRIVQGTRHTEESIAGKVVHPSFIREHGRYTIHAGYRHILLGMNREIEFSHNDEIVDGECSFRCKYLWRVLDEFAEELGRRQPTSPSFRSQVLNPIVQRQFRGVPDNNSDHLKQVIEGIWYPSTHGQILDVVHEYYLSIDPLHPQHRLRFLRHTLYVPQVRLSLQYLSRKPCSKEAYQSAMLLFLTKDSRDSDRLTCEEEEFIKSQDLSRVYGRLIEREVSSHHQCSVKALGT
jgi:hypothetical protein